MPRYTSYPTAPHFTDAVGTEIYRAWLERLEPEASLSIYLHVPFCRRLCWYCGCHTQIVHRRRPVDAYLEALCRELRTVAALVPDAAPVTHMHWGGGSPTLLSGSDIKRLADVVRHAFTVAPEAEFAVEVDPRGFDASRARALAEAGVTRVSLGVQDLNPQVQRAINRVQSLEETAAAAAMLRQLGITEINVDLMYGLPHQRLGDLLASIEQVLGLAPSRIALFGYAHVPWMKKHQRLIDETALPDPSERLAALQAGTERLVRAGYIAIGLDHFARPDDALARAAAEGRLKRNFQGYTEDRADALLGFGASAIGRLPQGYVQNAAATRDYVEAVASRGLATRRGVALNDEDRLRADIIECLMCRLGVDLAEVTARHGMDASIFATELAALGSYAADGLVRIDKDTISVVEEARPALRSIASVFDRYLGDTPARHAPAV